MSRTVQGLRPRASRGENGRTFTRRSEMAKYLLLKHYQRGPGAPQPPTNCEPMDTWTPQEVTDHIQYMRDFAKKLEGTGEFVDGQALAPTGTFVRYDGERSEEHTSELQSQFHLVCRLLLEKKKGTPSDAGRVAPLVAL